jgi:hypothetical protein
MISVKEGGGNGCCLWKTKKRTVRYFIIAGVSNLEFDGSWGFLVS